MLTRGRGEGREKEKEKGRGPQMGMPTLAVAIDR